MNIGLVCILGMTPIQDSTMIGHLTSFPGPLLQYGSQRKGLTWKEGALCNFFSDLSWTWPKSKEKWERSSGIIFHSQFSMTACSQMQTSRPPVISNCIFQRNGKSGSFSSMRKCGHSYSRTHSSLLRSYGSYMKLYLVARCLSA